MNSEKNIKQEGFSLNWPRSAVETTENEDGFFAMRGWQKKAFDLLKDASCLILNAPMGSGKSWLMCLLSAYKLKSKLTLRCIIAVPQTIIAPGFAQAKLQLPDGDKLHWAPAHNLCNRENSKATVAYVIKWLESSGSSLNDRTLLCTHKTLVSAYKKLKQENRLSLLKNLLLWVDEAHHIKNSIEGESNSMGTLVATLLDKASEGVEIGLTTATFFRGDRNSLLTPEMEERFKERFDLPYDDYLKSMNYLKSFNFDFLICGQDYTKAVEVLAKKHKGKDIVYIPRPMSRHSTGCKYSEVRNLIGVYQKEHDGDIMDTANGLTILKKADSSFKILDLVDEDRRVEKKQFLASEDLKDNREHLDVIIALDMFKEGANWIWADRSIIVGARGSLVDVIQMIGRLFRDAPGKEHVEIVQLLPFSLDQQGRDFKDNLNNYFKAILALLILEDVLNPVKILIPKGDEEGKNSMTPFEKNKNSRSVNDLIADESKRKSVMEAATRYLIEIATNDQNEGQNITALYNEFQNNLPKILAKDNINNLSEVEKIGKYIWSIHLRRSLKMQGVNVEDINFDVIQHTHPLDGLLRLTSGACGINTLKQLRKAIQSDCAQLTEQIIIDWIKQHINKHGKKPNKDLGIIDFTFGPYEGMTWAAVDIALKNGGRGLPGGSSLAKLIQNELGIRSYHNPPPLSNQLVVDWITKFIYENKRKPNKKDGIIKFADGEYVGETWSSVDMMLWRGGRGFPGALLHKYFLRVEDLSDLPHLSSLNPFSFRHTKFCDLVYNQTFNIQLELLLCPSAAS